MSLNYNIALYKIQYNQKIEPYNVQLKNTNQSISTN